MDNTKKYIIGILVVGFFAGFVTLLFGMLGPFYRTEVVNLPINLELPSNHKIVFTVDRSDDYLIEVHLKSIFSREKMDDILGDYRKSGGGSINVAWSIEANKSFLSRGSNTMFGYSPILGAGRSGLTIGTIKAEKGKDYTLTISTHNKGNDWNLAEPYIEVGLHPSKLENYGVLAIFGFLLISIFGIVFLVLALKAAF